jgi:mono/diheme cytochrome c family protein
MTSKSLMASATRFVVPGVLMCALSFAMAQPARTPTLTINVGGNAKALSAEDLLREPDNATVPLASDPFYGKAARIYRAVPVTTLIDARNVPPGASVQFRATDGFVAAIPAALLLNADRAHPRAWIAIDESTKPWPLLAKRGAGTPGPFALIWSGPGAAKVWSERWPYQIAEISVVADPASRWPQLAVGNLAAGSPILRGQQVFIAQCFVCHTFAGAGAAHVGPDLNRPMSPTQYFSATILRQYIRNPASVRDWPGRQMQGFSKDRLSDSDLAALIDFLAHKAKR